MTIREAAPAMLNVLREPMTLKQFKAAYPVANPIFHAAFLRTAIAAGDVTFNRVTNTFCATH